MLDSLAPNSQRNMLSGCLAGLVRWLISWAGVGYLGRAMLKALLLETFGTLVGESHDLALWGPSAIAP